MSEPMCKHEILPRETSEERKFRLEQQKLDAKVRLYKDAVLFAVGLGTILIISAICIWVILSPLPSASAINWATATLTSMVTGVTGYLTGKATNRI
jgi:uncharacterized membrane protein